MAALRPPVGPQGRRRDPSPLPAAGAGALRGSPSASSIANRHDHVWEVLHQRERSADDARQQAAGDMGARRVEAGDARSPPLGLYRREGDRPPSPARYLSVPAPAAQGWEVPQAGALEWRLEPKLPPPRRFRSMEPDAGTGSYADMTSWVERRLENMQADYKAEVASKLGNLEQNDRRFKEWVQREQEQLSGGLQQLKTSLDSHLKTNMDGQAQVQRQNAALQGQCQKLEMRLQEMEVAMAQTSAQAHGAVQSMQAMSSASAGGGTGGTGAAPNQAAVDALRMGLEREVAARTELGIEASDKIKELHRIITEVTDRHHLEAQSRAVQQSGADLQQQARIAAITPTLESMRGELDTLRETLRRTSTDCARRCEEAEAACSRRAANVQEAAMSAAKELWEEHLGVVAECKASLASLQQILEAKDKIMSQLQQLQQQQREDDKQEFANRQQQVLDAVRNRLRDVEVAFTSERNLRQEVQQATDSQINRMGSALEKAQADWIQDSSRLSEILKEIKQQLSATLDGEARGWERRLAEAVDGVMRRLEDLESRAAAIKVSAASLDEKVTELSRTHEGDVKELEARLKRDISDLDAMQTGKLSQSEFDLRNAVHKALSVSSEQARVDLARVEESAALERSVLRAAIQDNMQLSDAKVEKLTEDTQQRLSDLQLSLQERYGEVADTVAQLRKDTSAQDEKVKAHADNVSKDALKKCMDVIDIVRDDLAAQVTLNDHRAEDLRDTLAASEERHSQKTAALEESLLARLAEDLKNERESMQQEVAQLVDEERRARMKGESERVASLQRRLAAFEDILTRKLDSLKVEQDEALVNHRHSVKEALAKDRQEVRAKLEEIQRDQAESALAAKAELERLNNACESFAAECGEAIERTAADAEKANKELQERMTRELAASAAQVAIATATWAAELRKGIAEMESKIGAARAEAQEETAAVRREVTVVAANSAAELKIGLADMESKIGAARLMAQEDTAAHRREVDEKLQVMADGVTEKLDGFERKLDTQGAELTENLRAARADLEAALHEAKEMMKQETLELNEKLELFKDEQREELQKTAQEMLTGLDKVTSDIAELGETLEAKTLDIREHIQTSLQSAATSLVEKMYQLRAETEDKLQTAIRQEEARALKAEADIKKLGEDERQRMEEKAQAAVKEEEARALDAEGEIRAMVQEERANMEAKMESSLKEEEARSLEALAEIKKIVDEERNGVEEKMNASLKEEEARALRAEADLQQSVEDERSSMEERMQTSMREEEARAMRTAAEIKRMMEEQEAKVLASVREEQARATQTEAELKKLVEDEKAGMDEKLKMSIQEEEARATKAETELREIVEKERHAMEEKITIATGEEKARASKEEAELKRASEAAYHSLEEKIQATNSAVQAEEARSMNTEGELRKLIDEERSGTDERFKAAVREEEARATKVEAEIKKVVEDQRASMDARVESLVQEEKVRAAAAEDELRKSAEDARAATDDKIREAVHAEEVRAMKAESDIQQKLDNVSVSKETLEAEIRSEEARARQVEDEIKKLVESDRSSMDAKLAGLREDGEKGLKDAQIVIEEKVRLEEERAKAAEADIRKQVIQDVSEQLEDVKMKQVRNKSELDAVRKEVEEGKTASAELKKGLEAMEVAQADIKRKTEAHEAVQASSQAAVQAQLQDLTRQQREREEEGVKTLQAQVQSLKDEHAEKLQAEVTRATSAEDQLKKRLDEQEKEAKEAQKQIQEVTKEQDKVKASVEAVKSTQDKAAEQEAAAIESSAANQAEAQQAMEQQQAAREKLEEELRAVVSKQATLQEEVTSLKASQDKAAQDAEAAAKEHSKAEEDKVEKAAEGQKKLMEDQQKMEERLAAMEEKQGNNMFEASKTQAEVSLKVNNMQQEMETLSNAMGVRDAAIKKLHSKVDGGFAALNVKLETEYWMRTQIDAAADGIGNDFLRLLDQKCNHLEKRMEQLAEEKPKD
mmetsp:Transcript_39807/g.93771  ORF Transcript_39807/g.93771 Transcript_39807/m.93771 type:complete len:1965 (+) Transcript_39807:164-6058(+)